MNSSLRSRREHLAKASETIPDEEGTEMLLKKLSMRLEVGEASETIPDEEGTEIAATSPRISAAEPLQKLSPMRRGLKCCRNMTAREGPTSSFRNYPR